MTIYNCDCQTLLSEAAKMTIHAYAYFPVAVRLELNIFKLTFTIFSRRSFTPADTVLSNKALRRAGWGITAVICNKNDLLSSI